MALSSRVVRLLRILVPITFILFTSVYLLAPTKYLPVSRPAWTWLQDAKEGNVESFDQDNAPSEAEIEKEQWIHDAADWNIDGPYNGTALHALCDSTKWQPGLAFKCGQMRGGIGNIRNMFLSCLRYVIEAGGTSLIIPEITARDEDLIGLTHGKHLPFTYMFDLDFLRESMAFACPQMRLVTHETELGGKKLVKTDELYPKDLGGEVDPPSGCLKSTKEWRSKFDDWLSPYQPADGLSSASPVLVLLREDLPSLFDWPIADDPSAFIVSYGRILRFDAAILHLAGTVFYALNKLYGLNLSPNTTSIPEKHKFYGAHLRTDADAVASGFASYDEQSTTYLAAAEENRASLVYLASGSSADIEHFVKDAAERNIGVATKYSLLESNKEYAGALKQLKDLRWDQQALIDYVLLLRSSHFGGTYASSFSWNIAFLRHVAQYHGEWKPSAAARERTKSYTIPPPARGRRRRRGSNEEEAEANDDEELPEGTCYHDDISNIFGYRGCGPWFEMGMWP